MASLQYDESDDDIASSYVQGSPSIIYVKNSSPKLFSIMILLLLLNSVSVSSSKSINLEEDGSHSRDLEILVLKENISSKKKHL